MGMFDDIRVHVPLPVGDSETQWQTKSLDCQLEHYEIRSDGALWIRPMGMNWEMSSEWEPRIFTGEINFYSNIASEATADNPTGWTEYSAYFVNGQLQSLNRLLNRWLSQPIELLNSPHSPQH